MCTLKLIAGVMRRARDRAVKVPVRAEELENRRKGLSLSCPIPIDKHLGRNPYTKRGRPFECASLVFER